MAGIGDDIKSVLEELGTPVTIYKADGTVITGEYVDYDMYFEQSTEFIRQNCYSADFNFDSQASFGDVLDMAGIFVMIMNTKPTRFEDEIVIKNGFMVEMNCVGKFQRKSSIRVNMEQVVSWADTVPSAYALLIDGGRTSQHELTEEMITLAQRQTLYCPQYPDIRVGDRFYPDINNADEYYRIATITRRAFKNSYRMSLTQDNRE